MFWFWTSIKAKIKVWNWTGLQIWRWLHFSIRKKYFHISMNFKLPHLQPHITPLATTFQINSYLKTTPPQPGFDPAPPCTTTLSSSSIPAGCIQNFHHSVFPCFEFKLLFSLWDPPWNFKGYSYNSNMTSSRFYRKYPLNFIRKKILYFL